MIYSWVNNLGVNDMFAGREKELKTLNERYRGARKEFGVVYGRRKIGKTALLGEFTSKEKGRRFADL